MDEGFVSLELSEMGLRMISKEHLPATPIQNALMHFNILKRKCWLNVDSASSIHRSIFSFIPTPDLIVAKLDFQVSLELRNT